MARTILGFQEMKKQLADIKKDFNDELEMKSNTLCANI
jgi:hypothetical protein